MPLSFPFQHRPSGTGNRPRGRHDPAWRPAAAPAAPRRITHHAAVLALLTCTGNERGPENTGIAGVDRHQDTAPDAGSGRTGDRAGLRFVRFRSRRQYVAQNLFDLVPKAASRIKGALADMPDTYCR